MKVLVVVHGFPPASHGGSEVYADAVARTLAGAHGDQVLVLTRDADPARPELDVRRDRRNGVSIVRINNTFRNVRSFEEGYDNPAIGAMADRVIADFAPDVAHVHHLTCLSTSIVPSLARRGIPVFFTLHDYWLMCHRGQLVDTNLERCDGPGDDGCASCTGVPGGAGRAAFAAASVVRRLDRLAPGAASVARQAAGRLSGLGGGAGGARRASARRTAHMRGLVRHVSAFLAPSEHIRQRFIRFGVPADRIVHSPYGFDSAPFAARTRRHRTGGPLRIAFLGSLMVSKAPHVLLESFAALPAGSASLDLFGGHAAYHGDDSYREALAPLADQPGVTVHGALPHEDVPEALAGIDVLVVPSIWEENSPLVIQEAFLAGVPVVASKIGGISEAVTDGTNGLLVAPGDVAGLAAALRRLAENRELLRSLAAGIPEVRAIEDDVSSLRAMFERARAIRRQTPAAGRRRRLAAVVLNYRAPADTYLAVRSLLASRRLVDDVIVVDNDTDGSCARALASVRARVTCLEAGRNLGFPAGVNLGIRHGLAGGAGEVLLVNSDVFVPPDCIGKLDAALDDTPGAGIVGPVVVARAEPDRVASSGMSYRQRSGRMRHLGFGSRWSAPSSGRRPVDAVAGCLMLVRREVFDAVGLFDEDFFFGFEDLEFCLRARRAGFLSVVAADAWTLHEGGRSMGASSPRRLYFAARNHLLAARRARTDAGPVESTLRNASIMALNLAHAVRSGGGTLPSRLAAVARGTADYWRGRFGG